MKVDIHLLYPDFHGDVFMGGFLGDEEAVPGVYGRHNRSAKEGAIEVDGEEGAFDLDVRQAVIGRQVKGHHTLKEKWRIKAQEALGSFGRVRTAPHVSRKPLAQTSLPP